MNSCCKNMQTVSIEPAELGLFTVTTYCPTCKCKWIFHGCKVINDGDRYQIEIQRLADTPGITVEPVTLEVPEEENDDG